jgi:hypothetical protein
MYSTCIFCHASLGANEAVEHFPVGRRLAFDAARGRLWVVCRKCERWNLSPLEERWEAIEECERLFRDTRLRVSTDNIGLARLREGLELVRIGEPQRPEMAAWRYGDQFGRRRTRHIALTGAGLAAAAGLLIIGPATGLIAGGSWGLWNLASSANSVYQQRRVRARLVLDDVDAPAAVRLKQLNRVAVVAHEESWALRVPYEVPLEAKNIVTSPKQSFRFVKSKNERTALLTGEAALHVAGKLLPAINASGAKKNQVDSAVAIIEQAGDPSSLFERYAMRKPGFYRAKSLDAGTGHVVANLPKEVRLALEMATHEASERRALEGELTILEEAWKEAEEIAAIADDMFVPDDARNRLSSLKGDDPAR